MRVIAIADLFGLAGARGELQVLLATEQQAAVRQPGCRRYVFAEAVGDPDHFVLVGEWDDQAALDGHYSSADFGRFQSSLHGLLARPSELTMYSVSGAARPLPSAPMDPRDAD